jgi:GT2 family glycosyltransferase
MNWGIEHSSGSLICLLNVDILLETNYLEKCAQVLEQNNDVGMVSGVLYRLEKGEKTLIVDSLGIGLNRNRYHDDIGAGVRVEKPIQQTTSPFGVGGCAPVYSRKMISEISLDEKPFLELFESYYEDVDLAWRARKRGWKAVCTCETRAWHVREGSLSNKRLRAIARNRNHRNRIWLMVLNERPSILLRHLPFWVPLQVFFILKAFIQPGLFLVYIQTIRHLPAIIKIRIRRNRTPTILDLSDEEKLFSRNRGAYTRRIARYFRNVFSRT